MSNVNLADAKARLSELVDRGPGGRHDRHHPARQNGCPPRRTASSPRRRIDKAMLAALMRSLPLQPVRAAELVRSMRDNDRC